MIHHLSIQKLSTPVCFKISSIRRVPQGRGLGNVYFNFCDVKYIYKIDTQGGPRLCHMKRKYLPNITDVVDGTFYLKKISF